MSTANSSISVPLRRLATKISTLPDFAFLVLGPLLSVGLLLGASADLHVVILHTNDVHGHLLADGETGGSARIAGIVRQIEPQLLFDGGDIFTGTPIADMSEGRAVIDVMNAIGYDAVALGNHEFDNGINVLRERMIDADFRFLSANVEAPLEDLQQRAIFNVDGIRFGVIGLTTGDLKTTSHPKNMERVQVMDVVRAIENTLPRLAAQTDFLIVLAHIRPDEELRVARVFPEVDLIIGGHSHRELREPVRVGETMIVQAGGYGRFVGRVDIDFEDTEVVGMTARLIPTKDARVDAEIRELLRPYETAVASHMTSVVTHAPTEMKRSRVAESPVANLVADAFRKAGNTQIAVTNLGGIRADIRQGPMTRAHVFELLPFENTLITMKLSGRVLTRILSRELMAVSGIRVQLDLDRMAGERLLSLELSDGRAVEDDEMYSVTTNDFLVAGGDGLEEFGDGVDVHDTGVLMRDAFAAYVVDLETIPRLLDGRVRVKR